MTKSPKHFLEFKKFSNKEGIFSLEVRCKNCGEKFIEEFKIGSCNDCKEIFNEKVEAKLKELRSNKDGKPEWLKRIIAMTEVTKRDKKTK